MNEIIKTYIQSSQDILKGFDIDEEYFIKPILDCEWSIREVEGLMFFKYIKDGKEFEQVVVRKSGENLLNEQDNFTSIIAIDCVKIAFLVSNDKKI